MGAGMGTANRWAVVQELEWAGVRMLTHIAYDAIEPGGVVITVAGGVKERIASDAVIIAAGQEPQLALLGELAAARVPHLAVGGSAGAERASMLRGLSVKASKPLPRWQPRLPPANSQY